MWSRYILKRRVEKYQEETRSLLQEHRQSLAYIETRKVKIDCSFLPDSQWGIIGHNPSSPAWLLYLDVKISQPKDCSLINAKVEVTFQPPNSETQRDVVSSNPGPIITDYFGPQTIDKYIVQRHISERADSDPTRCLEKGYSISSNSDGMYGKGQIPELKWSLRGWSWPLAGDSSGLPRRIEWLVDDAVSCSGLRLGLVLQHDMKPFTIKVHIDGQLRGDKFRSFRFSRPVEQGRENTICRIVTPSGIHKFQLDDIASRLDYEMTRLNIRSHRGEINSAQQSICRSYTPRKLVTDSSYTHKDYTIAWMCALSVEMAAAKAMLDEIHPDLSVHPNDTNQYVLGRIGLHNIVLACLPQGVYGTTSAAVVATHMLYTFSQIRLSLMVGIGGGVPSAQNDIRLGDVVVSSPTGHFGGVVQHDLGKNVGDRIQPTGVLNKPPQALLIAIARLRTEHFVYGNKLSRHLDEMLEKHPSMRSNFSYLSAERDRLFEASYDHVESESTCEKCDQARTLTRKPRLSNSPMTHYGLIASGNQVMRNGVTRDKLAQESGILCFEMEAAGLMDNFSCLVIRGICDYADSHKNKDWQGYAAATAASYAKDLLSVVSVANIYLATAVGSMLQ